MTPVALTIAGSDPSGGAGVQADLKTFHQFGVYGEAVITLLTVQNTVRVEHVECMSAGLVVRQLRAVLEDIPPAAAKVGALGEASIVEALAEEAAGFPFPLVVDPVMISKHGAPLLASDACEALRTKLFPHAALVTPNLAEAGALAEIEITGIDPMKEAARRLQAMGPKAVLVTGGLFGESATDVLYTEGHWRLYSAPRVSTPHTHGTGCTYSAAIAAGLAKGAKLVDAIERAKAYIAQAILTNPGLGNGAGPVNHHAVLEAAG